MTDRRDFLRMSGMAASSAPFFVRNLLSKPPSGTIHRAMRLDRIAVALAEFSRSGN